jgi:hypothetical protein
MQKSLIEKQNLPDEEKKSELSNLLAQIELEEKETKSGLKISLIKVAEYILKYRDLPSEEECKATALLSKYHLEELANVNNHAKSWNLIVKELEAPYVSRCSFCGQILSMGTHKCNKT